MSLLTPERERPRAPAPQPLPPPAQPPRRRYGWLVALVLIGLVVLVVSGPLRGLLPQVHNPFREETVDRSQPALLRSLQDLHQYRAATGHVQVIVDVEKDTHLVPSFIKGERTLFVAAGSVDAGVDFSALERGAVKVSGDRRDVTVTLPHARLDNARVDPKRSRVFDRQRGLVDRVGSVFQDNPTSEKELYVLAERKLSAAARDGSGLRATAERNTRTMLEGMLHSLGFQHVTVSFRNSA